MIRYKVANEEVGEGLHVAVLYTDGLWYRGIVTEVKGRVAGVLLIFL